jgi:signal peptide peptidase SppA
MTALLDYCLRAQWGIEPGVMASLRLVMDRHFYGAPLDPTTIEAVTKARGEPRAQIPGDVVKEHGSTSLIRSGSVAVVPVEGVIARHASMVNGISQPQGMTTGDIRSAIAQAIAEPWARTIVLAVDSPGGIVDGTAELSEYIAGAAKVKPIHAVASGVMASCAYWLASGSTEIITGRTSLVGSIGVMAMVDDTSEALKAQGVKRLAIKAGQYKAAGAPGVEVTEQDAAEIERQLAATLAVFAGDVSKGRGISGERLASIANGRVWVGEEAVSMGLADRVGTLESVINELNRTGGIAASGRSNTHAASRKNDMSDTKIEAKTLAELKAEFPDQMKEHEEEVKAAFEKPAEKEDEAKPEAAATVAELKAAFPTDAAFAFACLDRGLTMSAALAERNRNLEAENAALKASAPKASAGAVPPKFNPGTDQPKTYAEAVAVVARSENVSKPVAMHRAASKYPGMYEEWKAEGCPAVTV